MRAKVAVANRSPYGWWIASYIELAVWGKGAKTSPRSRCIAWENTIILKAPNMAAAYKKALRLGSRNTSKFDGGHWEFMGLTLLLPIYEKLEDGAEIFWDDHTGKTLGKMRSLVKQKRAASAAHQISLRPFPLKLTHYQTRLFRDVAVAIRKHLCSASRFRPCRVAPASEGFAPPAAQQSSPASLSDSDSPLARITRNGSSRVSSGPFLASASMQILVVSPRLRTRFRFT